MLGGDTSRQYEAALAAKLKAIAPAGIGAVEANATLERLLREKEGKACWKLFDLANYRVTIECERPVAWESETNKGLETFSHAESVNTAIVWLQFSDLSIGHEIAEGVGPVNSFATAIHKALTKKYPILAEIVMTNFSVSPEPDSAGSKEPARVAIRLTKGGTSFGAVGRHKNLLEATWSALSDAFHGFLLTERIANDSTQ